MKQTNDLSNIIDDLGNVHSAAATVYSHVHLLFIYLLHSTHVTKKQTTCQLISKDPDVSAV